MTAEEEVLTFSLGKAESLSGEKDSLVIGSDTLVVLEGEKLGKPRDRDEAVAMLCRLAGRCHTIVTGLAIMGPDGHATLTHVERVRVEMRSFSHREATAYVNLGESMDKAGAYSIQDRGSELIAAIRGDYLAAVGLPLRPVARRLEHLGLQVPIDVERLYQEREFRNWNRIRVLDSNC